MFLSYAYGKQIGYTMSGLISTTGSIGLATLTNATQKSIEKYLDNPSEKEKALIIKANDLIYQNYELVGSLELMHALNPPNRFFSAIFGVVDPDANYSEIKKHQKSICKFAKEYFEDHPPNAQKEKIYTVLATCE